jgi:hypothetical protein
VTQVAGVEHELLFVGAASRPSDRRPHAGSGQALDDAEQLERTERLQEERVGAGGARHLLDVFHPREEDDADATRVLAPLQLAAEREPVHSGHAHVEDDHVRTRGADALLGLGRAPGLVHLDLHVLERRPQQGAEGGIVVDKQQAHRIPPGSKALSTRLSADRTEA